MRVCLFVNGNPTKWVPIEENSKKRGNFCTTQHEKKMLPKKKVPKYINTSRRAAWGNLAAIFREAQRATLRLGPHVFILRIF